MPKVRAVDEMNATELQTELVWLLADCFMRYMHSEQFAIDHVDCDKDQDVDCDEDQDFETACLELPAKPVLSVTGRVGDR